MKTPAVSIEQMIPGGIRDTDIWHKETNDGTCSRCQRKIDETEVPLMLWSGDGRYMLIICEVCLAGEPMDKPVVIAPPNRIQKIESVWLVVSCDEDGEGVCAASVGGTLMPLIAADEDRLEWVKQKAATLAALTTKKLKLIKLETRVDLEEFAPTKEGK